MITIILFRCVFKKLIIMLFARTFEKIDFNVKKLSVFRISAKIDRIIISNFLKKFNDVDITIINESKNILSINKKSWKKFRNDSVFFSKIFKKTRNKDLSIVQLIDQLRDSTEFERCRIRSFFAERILREIDNNRKLLIFIRLKSWRFCSLKKFVKK